MKKGFTLIEVLFVIFTISILTGISYFGFTSIKYSMDVHYSARQVFSDLRSAQNMAKTIHYPHQVVFYRGSNKYQIINLDDDIIVKNETVAGTVWFSGKETFIFSSSGNPVVGGSGTLFIKNLKGKQRKVVVSSSGRIRIE